MTQNEFASWLDGFLDGKLSPEDLERVRMKAREVVPAYNPAYPSTPQSPGDFWFVNPWPPVVTGTTGTPESA